MIFMKTDQVAGCNFRAYFKDLFLLVLCQIACLKTLFLLKFQDERMFLVLCGSGLSSIGSVSVRFWIKTTVSV